MIQPRAHKSPANKLFRAIGWICCLSVLLIMTGIVIELVINSQPSMKAFGWRFLTTSEWDPVAGKFGALSSILGTISTTLIALIIAVPLSIAISLFLVELAPKKLSGFLGTAIELLAAIPSIIYGMWGLYVLVPLMGQYINPALNRWLGSTPLFSGPFASGLGILTAGSILALMILPFITAVIRDVLMMVPPVMKESAYGLGATTWEVTRDVSIPYGVRGIVGAVFIGLGRAIGETMAVTFVLANEHLISPSLFAGGNTIASTLAVEFTEASEGLYMSSLIELGLVLFLITALFQVIAQFWLQYAGRKGGAK